MKLACEWATDKACCLPYGEGDVVGYTQRSYCPAHLPIEAPGKDGVATITQLQGYVAGGGVEIAGAEIPANVTLRFLRGVPEIALTDCRFGDGVTIDLIDATVSKTTIVRAQFLGRVSFRPALGAILNLAASRFPGDVLIANSSTHSYNIDLSGSEFQGSLNLQGTPNGQWSFRRATFHKPISVAIGGKPSISQSCTFAGARFLKGAYSTATEGPYRVLRQAFESNSDRDNEGVFYALEKRSHRLGLRPGIERVFSFLYDIVSEYGQNYGRSLVWLAIVQLAFLCVYGAMAGRIELLGTPDANFIAFTLGQITKPFELLGVRANSDIAQIVMTGSHSPAVWALLGFLHSAISISLFALFLLALRWRFKRA